PSLETITPEPMPCSRRSSCPCGPKKGMNGIGDALILVTLVIEMLTTEGNTRSVMSAIDSAPTRFSAAFGTTVTGAALVRVSAAISGGGAPPDFAQPAAAT